MRFEAIEGGWRVHCPAKINLYLEIGPRRDDGYHDIDSLFQAVSLFDEIELRQADRTIELDERGVEAGEDNLVYKAARLLREYARDPSLGVRILVRKGIPMGAGLGGGSSDAAGTLMGLLRLWNLDVPRADILALGAQLGSDVPFFFSGGTARCRGRGEQVECLRQVDAEGPFHYVLVYPNIHLATAGIYRALDDSRDPNFTLTASSPLDSIGSTSIRHLIYSGELVFNRFETIVYSLFPPLQQLRTRLQKESFVHVLMSGSGSTLFGLCRDEHEAQRLASQLRVNSLAGTEVYAVQSLGSWGA